LNPRYPNAKIDLDQLVKIFKDSTIGYLKDSARYVLLKVVFTLSSGIGWLKLLWNVLKTLVVNGRRIAANIGDLFAQFGKGLLAAAQGNAGAVAMAVKNGMNAVIKLLLMLLSSVFGLRPIVQWIQQFVSSALTNFRYRVMRFLQWLLFRPSGCNVPMGGRGQQQPPMGGSGRQPMLPSKPPGQMRQCFDLDEPLAGTRGFGSIGDARLGMRVKTWLPGEWGYAIAQMVPDTPIDAPTWRKLTLMQEEDGEHAVFQLLRPLTWLLETGAIRVGDRVELNMPEMGVVGTSQVMAVDPCPPIEPGAGRIITGVYHLGLGAIWHLYLHGDEKPLRVTENHPFWSAERLAWVPARQLADGELLLIADGNARVCRVEPTDEVRPVCNVEVDADHCYRIGNRGILVHNASTTATFNEIKSAQVFNSEPEEIKSLVRAVWAQRKPLLTNGKAMGNWAGALVKGSNGIPTAENNEADLPGTASHSEQLLIGKITDSNPCAKITAIFTERRPCNKGAASCKNFIINQAMTQGLSIAVYSFPVSTGAGAPAAVATYWEKLRASL
jgi:hypothetical protein